MNNELKHSRKPNAVAEKSYDFALNIVRFHQGFVREQKEYVLSKQLLRSATSVGANVEEAVHGYSKKDFRAKLGIAYKEAQESKYWLRLLKDSGYIDEKLFIQLFNQCDEVSRIIYAIMSKTKIEN
ncbi:MAG: four helix bundle protein [Cyclobacteriaceae bacterium]